MAKNKQPQWDGGGGSSGTVVNCALKKQNNANFKLRFFKLFNMEIFVNCLFVLSFNFSDYFLNLLASD
jgi:hypothetical protein